MTGPDDNHGRDSPGAGPTEGIDPATAAESPQRVAEAMDRRRLRAHRQRRRENGGGRRGGRRRHRQGHPLACALVGPQEMCRGPSLHDGLPSSTHRHVAEPDRIPQPIYLGIEVEVLETQQVVRYGLCTHDGSYTLDYYDEEIDVSHLGNTAEKVEYFEAHIIKKLKEYQVSMNFKAHLIGLGLRVCNTMCVDRQCATMCIDYGKERIFHVYGSDAPSLSSRVWTELDAIPFVMRSRGHTLDERASTAVRQAVMAISPQYPGNIPRISIGYRNEVEVDCNSDVHLYDLEHYRAHCSEGTWHAVLAMAAEIRDKNLRVSFFNSTPQGGGVALMRHALIRFCQHLQVNVHWYVTTPSPDVFSITKRKFHNVLQGVAPPDVCLDDVDKAKWLEWTKMNVMRHWDGDEGPIKTSDVIVIDDPQVSGLIPWIRQRNPKAKIVYRSHIEIRADLIRDDPQGPQAQTWDFLWSAIKQADVFVSHPVANFIPDDVPMENVVIMPAATDPLDGLNKPLDAFDVTYYQQVFNRICYDQGSRRVNWDRPYITQVARFDPSKGIPDVLLAYQKLYHKYIDAFLPTAATEADEGNNGGYEGGWERLDEELRLEARFPQLIICGHGSVDDPDGTWVFEEAHSILQREGYRDLLPHVTIVRIPPCDQILNVVLRGAVCALQLSHREGFEVKITEAISKGVPVVAYRAGGIPFQIRHGETGYLVPVGDTDQVAEHVFQLTTDKALRGRLSAEAAAHAGEEFFTVHNWACWAYIWLKVLDKPHGPPKLEELATAVAAASKQTAKAAAAAKEYKKGAVAGADDDDDASTASGASTGGSEEGGDYEGDSSSSGDESIGSKSEEGEFCLNVDGSRRACVPQLHRRRQSPKDVLGGGVWVKELWKAEYGCCDTTPEGLPKFEALHGHHVKNRATKLWFRNQPSVREAGLPPIQQRLQHHRRKHDEPLSQDEREAMAEAAAVRAAAKAAAAAATGIDSTEGAPPAKLSLARQDSECSSGSGDAAAPVPRRGSGRLHAVITEQFTRPAPPASELPPPVGEIERDKEKAKAAERASKTAGADSVASVVATPLALPSGVPEPHAETEEEAEEKAALLLGPLEAKLKREASGTVNPLTGGAVALAEDLGGGAGGMGPAALKPLPTLLRAGMEGQGGADEGATMATTAGHM